MKYTISINENRDFKYLYKTAKSEILPVCVVYYKKNKQNINRLGITVSTKLGGAVVRNKIRRRIKESYRLSEHKIPKGYDIIIVARTNKASYKDLNRFIIKAINKINDIIESKLDNKPKAKPNFESKLDNKPKAKTNTDERNSEKK